MTDEPPAAAGDSPSGDPDDSPEAPEEKFGWGFYASLALLGLLVLMVVVFNFPAAQENAGLTMTSTNWTLQSFMDATGVLIPARSGTSVTAMFDREGQMSGTAGCNRYSARYLARDYSLTFTNISSARMFCQGPGIMEQESAFLEDLSGTSSFGTSNASLKFYNANGKTVLVFVPA
jgi:heat shock protein HslJ